MPEAACLLKIVQNGLVLRQAGVDVLGVDADLAAVAPADFPGQRLEGVHHRPEERRFALAVVADDGRPRAVIDLQLDVGGDLPLGVADRQIAAAQGRALARLDPRRADPGRRLVAGDLRQFQAFELLALRFRQRRGAGAGLVPGDEVFQVPPLGEDGLVRAFLVLAFLALEFQIGIDLAGKGRQFAPGQVERVVAGGAEKRPIVGDDQTRRPMALQEVFQENLGAQVEEVRRLVEQQEVRLVQQQRRQLHARLPAAGELGDGAFEVGPLQLELPGDFAAFPVGLAAVAHQKFEGGLLGKKGIVLAQIAQAQARMADDFAAVEFFLAEQNPEQRAFAGPVAADEPHLDVVAQRGLGAVEQHLIAVAFAGFCDLQQAGHRE